MSSNIIYQDFQLFSIRVEYNILCIISLLPFQCYLHCVFIVTRNVAGDILCIGDISISRGSSRVE